MSPTPRLLAVATIIVIAAGTFSTAAGIQERFERAQSRLADRAVRDSLPGRFHSGALPCRRYLDATAIPPAETATTAAALVGAGLTRWMPDALLVTWSWAEEDEARHHGRPRSEEQVEVILDALSPIDRFWLRTIGRNRLAELTADETETTAQLTQHAKEATARMPPELQGSLREIWTAHPGPLARPAEVGLVDAVRKAAAGP